MKACFALAENLAARIGCAVIPRMLGAGVEPMIVLTGETGDGNPTVDGSRTASAANASAGMQLIRAAAPHFAQ
jgi:hypothetical protein